MSTLPPADVAAAVRRARVVVRGVVQGWASAPSCTGWPPICGSPGTSPTPATVWSWRSRVRLRPSICSAPASCPTLPARGGGIGGDDRDRRRRGQRVPHRPVPRRRSRPHAGRARHGDLRRLPGRARRPRRPAPPAPVRHLYALRAAFHHRHRPAVRPRAHDDGALSPVPRLRPRVPRSRRPAVPRAARRLSVLRSASAARRGPRGHRASRRRPRRRGALAARRGSRPRRQGHRRLPPGL